ncbi:tellurium resistance protein [Rhodococcus ruber]|nr:tellurium resistance protein [Rhodococcus ruber]
MPALPPGANTVIHDGTATLSVSGARQGTVDLMAFQLTVDQRVRNDDDFIFFNQPKSPEGAVRLIGADRISLDLNLIPAHIHTLSIAVALDESVSGSLATVPGLGVTLEQPTGLVVQAPASGLSSERAAILMEVYRRNGTWKVRNVSQGWNTGLSALATNYGVDVTQPAPPAPTPTPPAAPSPNPSTERRGVPPSRPPVSTPVAPPVTLSKITLDKSTPSVSLVKAGEEQGVMRVNLNWTTRGSGKGFLGRLAGSNSIDLDLGCLYEMADGSKGVIQALGEAFGSRYSYPYIELDGDDRTGSVAGGENLYIDLSNPSIFKRILIFAYIYEGVPNWAAADGVVTLYRTSGSEIEVRLDSGDNRAPMCAIALLESKNGEINVNREVRYIKGDQSHLDKAYKWKLRWTPGSK